MESSNWQMKLRTEFQPHTPATPLLCWDTWHFGLIAPDETTLGYVLRYIRYATATLWMTYAAPLVFLKIKLAETET